jgi:uncharacterized Zn-finger protein
MNCDSSNAILQTYMEVYMVSESQPQQDPDTMDDDNNSMPLSDIKTEQPAEEIVEEEFQIEYLDDIADTSKSFISMLKTDLDELEEAPPVHIIEVPKFPPKLSFPEDKKKKYPNKNTAEVCAQCGNTYRSKSILAIHMKRHAGVKAFGCEKCDAKFVTRSGVTRHMRTHTGEKPYPCSVCDAAFSDYSTRNRHER